MRDTPLLLGKDRNGATDYAIPFTENSYQWQIAAAATDTLAVPDTATKVLIQVQAGATVFVGLATIAASTSTATKTGAQMNPTLRTVKKGDVLNFFAVNAAEICVTFYEE